MTRRRYGDTKRPTGPYPGQKPNQDKGKDKEVGDSPPMAASSKMDSLDKRVVIYTVFEGINVPVKDSDTVTSVMDLYRRQIAYRHKLDLANVEQLLSRGTRVRPISYGEKPKKLDKPESVDTNRFLDLFTSPETATTPPADELAVLVIIPHTPYFFKTLIVATELNNRYQELQNKERVQSPEPLTRKERKIKNGAAALLHDFQENRFAPLTPLSLRLESAIDVGIQTDLVEPQNPTTDRSTINAGIQVNPGELRQSIVIVPAPNVHQEGKRKAHQRQRSQELLEDNLEQMAIEGWIRQAKQEQKDARADMDDEYKRHSKQLERIQDENASLKDNLAATFEMFEKLRRKLEDLEGVVSKERSERKREADQLKREADQLKREADQLKREADQLKEKVSEERHQRKLEVDKSRQESSTEIISLKLDLERVRQEHADEVAQQRNERERLDSRLTKEKEDLELKAKREKEELETRLALLQADTKNADRKIEKYSLRLDRKLSNRIYALEAFALTSDPEALFVIRLRVILDTTQGRLAVWVGLVAKFDRDSSLMWRSALDGNGPEREENLTVRIERARNLLQRNNLHKTNIHVKAILQNTLAMEILAEADSDVRHKGDTIAHNLPEEHRVRLEVLDKLESEPKQVFSLFYDVIRFA